MRKTWMFLIGMVLCFTGINCKKSTCSPRTPDQDAPLILAYLNANNITGYIKDPSGLYYKIDDPGTGPMPNGSSTLYVKYTGKFTDNSVFDSASDASQTAFVLQTLIAGWQIGLPLIAKGGKIHLYIPSALGYGCGAVGTIPSNAVLIFDIELVDLK